MNKVYSRIIWKNYPNTSTAINETNLNRMDKAIDDLDNRVIEQDSTKANQTTVNNMVKNWTMNETTGVITVEKQDGSRIMFDLNIEKIPVNFELSPSGILTMTTSDGTQFTANIGSMIPVLTFNESDQIAVSVSGSGVNKTYSFTVKDGSITESKLQPNYLANIKTEVAKAQSSEVNAQTYSKLAQSYAVGSGGAREDEATDNAKYYYEQAKQTDIGQISSKVDEINSNLVELQGNVDFMNKELPLSKTTQGTNPTIQDSTKAPLIYGKFNGYTEQDGTPTPDAPIEIKGLADSGSVGVKTCGKNLVKISDYIYTKTLNGITLTNNKDGTYTLNGTSTDEVIFEFWKNFEVKANYILSSTLLSGSVSDKTKVLCAFFQTSNWNGTYTTLDSEKAMYYMSSNLFRVTIGSGVVCNNAKVGVMVRDTGDSTYEPYTETQALIPVSEPLYDGDYIEVYADGSGQIVRKTIKKVLDSSLDWSRNGSTVIRFYFTAYGDTTYQAKSNIATSSSWDDMQNGVVKNAVARYEQYIGFNFTDCQDMTLEEFKTWIDEQNAYVIFGRTTLTTEPLTAEQVEQFKNIYTFDIVTNFFCDGEITARYYVNTDSGDTVGMLQEQITNIKNDLDKLNALPIGTIIQIEADKDTIATTEAKYSWQYLGTSNIQYENGSSTLLVTNVYRKNN